MDGARLGPIVFLPGLELTDDRGLNGVESTTQSGSRRSHLEPKSSISRRASVYDGPHGSRVLGLGRRPRQLPGRCTQLRWLRRFNNVSSAVIRTVLEASAVAAYSMS